MLVSLDEFKRRQKEADWLASCRDEAVKSNADEDWIEFGRQLLLLEEHAENCQRIIELAFPYPIAEHKLSIETARLSLVYACRRFIEERSL